MAFDYTLIKWTNYGPVPMVVSLDKIMFFTGNAVLDWDYVLSCLDRK